jgi:hypothetical protein
MSGGRKGAHDRRSRHPGVPRIIRTGPHSAVSIWPPDEDGIAATTFHSLVQPERPTPGPLMNIEAIRAAVRPAVLSDDLFEACALMERAAGIAEGSFVAGRLPEMSWRIALEWAAFYEPADRAESLRYWLIVERLWPMLKINSKEISQVPG